MYNEMFSQCMIRVIPMKFRVHFNLFIPDLKNEMLNAHSEQIFIICRLNCKDIAGFIVWTL